MRAHATAAPNAKPLFALISALAVISGGCVGEHELTPTPAPAASGLACQDAFVIGSALEQPSRIQVWNATQADMRITLDECGRQRHLGWVKGGAVASFALPERLVQFDDGLRFHAYPMDVERASRVISVQPGALLAKLVIAEEGEEG